MTTKTSDLTSDKSGKTKRGKGGIGVCAETEPILVEPAAKMTRESFAAAYNVESPGQAVDKEPPPAGIVTPKLILKCLNNNEDGDASLFIKINKNKRLYDLYADPNFAWYYWNDHYWRQDIKKEAVRSMSDVVDLYDEQRQREEWELGKLMADKQGELSEGDKNKVAKIKKTIKDLKYRKVLLQTLQRKNNIARLSTMGVDGLGFVGDQWDKNPWLLGCKNGVIDLKTGERRDGRPEDYIKNIAPVAWDEDAECPAWKEFLFTIFEGDQEVVDFMQRLLGYAVTGLRTEHIFPILWGERGRNGKGTILETLKCVLGELAYRAPTDLLLQQNKNTTSGSGPNSALMKLMGSRIVWASEPDKKDRLDAARIKEYSGGDTISSRNPHGRKQIEFTPTHTLFLLTNPRPQVDAEDDAFWQRVILIPFNVTFVEHPNPKKPWELKKNTDLPAKLETEAAGILKWLVQGTMAWAKQGLNVPKKLKVAAKDYRDHEDLFRHFLDARCHCEEDNMQYRTKPKDLYFAYKDWCSETGYKPLNQKHFNESARKKFGEVVPDCGYRTYRGVILLS